MAGTSDTRMYEQISAELAKTQHQVQQLTLELKEAKAKLHQLVYRDGLSGVYNHRYCQEMIRKELERSLRYLSPFTLILLDLDAFTNLNERYGHETGDLVLMNVARVIEREVRPSDIVARYGGAEFAVILPETGLHGASTLAGRLCQSIEDLATLVRGTEIKTTISIGGATFVPNSSRANKRALVKTAENALAGAKQKGRGQIEVVELA